MSKTGKRIAITCSTLLVVSAAAAAVLLILPILRSPAQSSSETSASPKLAEEPKSADESLWSCLTSLSKDYDAYNKEIVQAYKEKDRDKLMFFLAKQVVVNLGRCRKQLDNTADDPDVGYRDEVMLYYALRLRSLELSYSDVILKKLADKNDDSASKDKDSLLQFGDFISAEIAMRVDLGRCAQLHGGYMLWKGRSEDEVRRACSEIGLQDKEIDLCMFEAKARCAMLNDKRGAASGGNAGSAEEKTKNTQYLPNAPGFYRNTEDRMWNTANYLSLCLQNELWWMKTFSNKRGDKLQKKLSDDFAADLQMCRRKFEAVGSSDAPDVKKAALAMCSLGDSVLNHINAYRNGQLEEDALTAALQKEEAEFAKKKAALEEARRSYLMRVIKDRNKVNYVMWNDGISPMQFKD